MEKQFEKKKQKQKIVVNAGISKIPSRKFQFCPK